MRIPPAMLRWHQLKSGRDIGIRRTGDRSPHRLSEETRWTFSNASVVYETQVLEGAAYPRTCSRSCEPLSRLIHELVDLGRWVVYAGLGAVGAGPRVLDGEGVSPGSEPWFCGFRSLRFALGRAAWRIRVCTREVPGWWFGCWVRGETSCHCLSSFPSLPLAGSNVECERLRGREAAETCVSRCVDGCASLRPSGDSRRVGHSSVTAFLAWIGL